MCCAPRCAVTASLTRLCADSERLAARARCLAARPQARKTAEELCSFAPVMYALLVLAKAAVAVPTLEPSVLSGPTGPTVTIAPGVDMP